MRGRLARSIGWCADAGRFVYAAFSANWGKWRYTRNGRTGRCPCQNQSDEPKLGLVRCDVVRTWDSPGRFRPLCPALVSTADGWRCSVPAAQVRPYWGRVFLFGGGAVAAFYLAGVLAVFAFLRWGSGLPVRVVDVAYPPHWHRVRETQAERFFARAMHAFTQSRFNEAYLALLSARERYPSHYESSLWIARLTMFQGSDLFSDDQFSGLRREHPEQAYRTAVVYHDTLLMLQRFERLAGLSLEMALADPARAQLWVRSLLFSLRVGSFAATFAESHRAEIEKLSPLAQILVRAEAEVDGGRPAAAVALLSPPFSGPLNPVYMELQVDRLDSLGARDVAQSLLDAYGPLLGEFRHALAQFHLDLGASTDFEATASLRRLLTLTRNGPHVDALAEMMIARPRADVFRRVHAAVRARPDLAALADRPSFWLAALLSGAPDLAAEWAADGGKSLTLPRIKSVDLASRDFSDPRSPVNLINSVTLPREAAMALLLQAPVPDVEPLPKRAPLPTRR